jgi:prepilin-type N-terminal cleavage/methylation domain-containing protein
MSAGTPTQDGPQTRRRQLPRVGRARHRRGFTFIELMVAISIIAVLMAIMLPRLVEARYQAYHSACIENERNIATALESYQVDNRGYPPSLLTLSQDPAKAYISTVPVCPSDPAQPYN